MIGSVFCQWYSFKDHIYHVVPLCTFRGSFAVSTDFPQHFVSAAGDSFVRSPFPAIPVLHSPQREAEPSEFHVPLLRPSAFLCGGVKSNNLKQKKKKVCGADLNLCFLVLYLAPERRHPLLLCLNPQIYPPTLHCLPLPTIFRTAAPTFISLNSPAVGVTPGLVFCGDICVSLALWMALKAGFTAPAVRPQHLGLSRLAVKWSAGPPG